MGRFCLKRVMGCCWCGRSPERGLTPRGSMTSARCAPIYLFILCFSTFFTSPGALWQCELCTCNCFTSHWRSIFWAGASPGAEQALHCGGREGSWLLTTASGIWGPGRTVHSVTGISEQTGNRIIHWLFLKHAIKDFML